MFRKILNFEDYAINEQGDIFSLKSNKFLRPKLKYNGYLEVTLCQNRMQTTFYLHRLVFEAHIGPIPEGYQINHLDEDKTNNYINNLECVTPAYNVNYSSSYAAVNGQPTVIYDANNVKHYVYNIKRFAKEHGLNQGHLNSLINGKLKQHKGFTLEPKVNLYNVL